MKKVFINGYGSIGSRITSFLKDDPEITVMGIGKYSPDEKVNVAISRGLNVYVPERKLNDLPPELQALTKDLTNDIKKIIPEYKRNLTVVI